LKVSAKATRWAEEMWGKDVRDGWTDEHKTLRRE
jgi:hypothetical protein